MYSVYYYFVFSDPARTWRVPCAYSARTQRAHHRSDLSVPIRCQLYGMHGWHRNVLYIPKFWKFGLGRRLLLYTSILQCTGRTTPFSLRRPLPRLRVLLDVGRGVCRTACPARESALYGKCGMYEGRAGDVAILRATNPLSAGPVSNVSTPDRGVRVEEVRRNVANELLYVSEARK